MEAHNATTRFDVSSSCDDDDDDDADGAFDACTYCGYGGGYDYGRCDDCCSCDASDCCCNYEHDGTPNCC